MTTEVKPLQAAGARPPRLLVPSGDLDTSEVSKAIETIKDELSRVGSALAPAN